MLFPGHRFLIPSWSSTNSSLFCFANSALYVLVLYFVPSRVRSLPRDNPLHIKYRLSAALVATVLSLMSVLLLPYDLFGLDYWSAIGIQFKGFFSSLMVTFLLMCVFYLGPLVAIAQFGYISMRNEVQRSGTVVPLEIPRSSLEIVHSWIDELYGDIVILRNIVVGPITEEIVFRAVLIPSLAVAAANDTVHVSQLQIAALCPLWFGVAHLHHLVDRARNKVPLISNLVTTLVQLTYTSIFGFMAALLFLRTGNMFCPILSHVMCNLIGLPDVGFMNRPDSMGSSSEYSCLFQYRYLHLFLHVLGLVLFACLLYPATEFLQNELPYNRIMYWNPPSELRPGHLPI